jgi:hypothetical protein
MPPGHGTPGGAWVPPYPSYPHPMAPMAVPPSRPQSVTAAFWFTLAGVVLFLVVVGLGIGVGWDDLRDVSREELVEDGERFTSADIDTSARGGAFGLCLAALVMTAPYVTFAAVVLRGRNWARVLLTVLVSIGGFVSIFALFPAYDSPLGGLLRVAVALLVGSSITVVTLLFGRAANQYFTSA